MWREGNPGALLEGMENGGTAIENIMEVRQKLVELP